MSEELPTGRVGTTDVPWVWQLTRAAEAVEHRPPQGWCSSRRPARQTANSKISIQTTPYQEGPLGMHVWSDFPKEADSETNISMHRH